MSVQPQLETTALAVEAMNEPKPDITASTPRSQVAHAIRFLLVGAAFALPLLILVGIPTLLLFLEGEVMPLGQVIRLQKRTDRLVLYGPAVSGPDGAFKLQSVLERKPRLLAMGSSRVMPIRSKFFKDSKSFYNSGGSVSGFRHFRQFLQNIPEGQEPKLIVMAFEQRYFNAACGHFMPPKDYDEWLHWEQDTPKILLDGVRDTYRKVLIEKRPFKELLPVTPDGKYTLADALHALRTMERIGLTARAKSSGYRNDGSYYYGKYISDPTATDHWDYQFRETLNRMTGGISGFQYGDDVWQETLDEIELLLPYCKKRGIHVVAFMPAIAPTVLDRMRQSGNFTYVDKIMPRAEPIFRKHGFHFFDFTDMREIGSGDHETIDGWHASEKAYLRAFIKMAEVDETLRREVDLPELKTRLAATKGDFDVFGPNEY